MTRCSPDHTDWCYTCERFHCPMDYGDGCYTELDVRRERENPGPLPWAPSFGWLTGRQCRARLRRRGAEATGRWGRCELHRDHLVSTNSTHWDHALEFGLEAVRWRINSAGALQVYPEVAR